MTPEERQLAAGQWLLKNRNILHLIQFSLVEKFDEASEFEHCSTDLEGFLSGIDDAIQALGTIVADLRQQPF